MSQTICYECRKKYNVGPNTFKRKQYLDRALIQELAMSHGTAYIRQKVVYFCKSGNQCYTANKMAREATHSQRSESGDNYSDNSNDNEQTEANNSNITINSSHKWADV